MYIPCKNRGFGLTDCVKLREKRRVCKANNDVGAGRRTTLTARAHVTEKAGGFPSAFRVYFGLTSYTVTV